MGPVEENFQRFTFDCYFRQVPNSPTHFHFHHVHFRHESKSAYSLSLSPCSLSLSPGIKVSIFNFTFASDCFFTSIFTVHCCFHQIFLLIRDCTTFTFITFTLTAPSAVYRAPPYSLSNHGNGNSHISTGRTLD